ncbi:dynein axonemal assembly factor 9-like [Oscarella lobularis]|uniref:dynein axonemal assembly factor 9-like n=1 Tax=Oscarella lobularis TaxID=121494 RepID=UPI0033138DF5
MDRRFPFVRPQSSRDKTSRAFFGAFESVARLRRVQQIVGSHAEIDVILCILGVDSRFNDESRKLVGYLLFGHSGRQIDDPSLGFDDDVMEDVVLAIGSNFVEVYCNPVNFASLLPFISHWPNVQLFCPRKEEFEDGDLAEDFKVQSFIAMSRNRSNVGIPFGLPGGEKFDPMLIEKWPLIQSYALEDYGCGGFFTMHHDVVDVAGLLAPLYDCLDLASLLHIVTCILPLFEGQFNSVVQNVDIVSSNSHADMLSLREDSIGEPLSTYFTHGLGNQPSSDASLRGPVLLAGINTQRQTMASLDGRLRGAKMTQSAIGTLGQHDGEIATHMLCECDDPKGALSCSRTYFFHTGFLSDGQSKGFQAQFLTELYHIMIQSVYKAIDVYVKTLSCRNAEESCFRSLKSIMKDRQIRRENVVFSMWARNSHGQPVDLVDGKRVSAIKTARLIVYDVPGTTGSLAYADSFLDSSIQVNRQAETQEDTAWLSLTESIPAYVAWPGDAEEVRTQLQLANKIKASTRVLLNDDAYLVMSEKPQRWLKGKLIITSELAAFKAPHFGYVSFPFEHVDSVKLYNAGSPSDLSFLLLCYSDALLPRLPFVCRQSSCTLALALMPASPAYRAFYKHVSPVWKTTSATSSATSFLEDIDELPDEFEEIYRQLRFHYRLNARGSSARQRAQDKSPQLDRFAAHVEASACLQGQHVPSVDELSLALDSTVFNDDRGEGGEESKQIAVTVIAGMLGSGKHQLSERLVNLDKEGTRWIVLRQPLDNCDDFNPEDLQSFLSSIVTKTRQRKTSSGSGPKKRTRILIVTPGVTGVKEVIHAVVQHPSETVRECLTLGAVTSCVDLTNCCADNGQFFPNLLSDCSSGLANNIVWTTNADADEMRDYYVEQLIRACNPSATYIQCPSSKALTDENLLAILSDTAFSDPSNRRIRLLLHPDMLQESPVSRPTPSHNFHSICLKFYLPLERQLLVSQLSVLKSRSSDTVYHIRARLTLTDSPVFHDLEFVRQSKFLALSSATDALPATSKENVIVFWGTNLNEERLKNWLKQCRKQLPQTKKHRTKEDLSHSEIAQIQRLHKLDPLPEGHFFNGYHYVSLAGDKSDTHPLLPTFIDDYVAQENARIDRHNEKVARGPLQDLFSAEH